MDKPHKGTINRWYKRSAGGDGLGYVIVGAFNHTEFGYTFTHTSHVVAHGDDGEVETRNSRYTLMGPEVPEWYPEDTA